MLRRSFNRSAFWAEESESPRAQGSLDLTDPGSLKAFLARHGLSADKGLGQHFLCSSSAVRAILSRLDAVQGVLEIGPGPGVLTRPISSASKKVIALELDPRMISALGESAPSAEARNVDALQVDLSAILTELPQPRAVVSNLPYYITGALLGAIADAAAAFDTAVLMMQKEVAARITAPAGDSNRGSLSVFLQAVFTIAKVADVPPGAFVPPPKVDSRILEFVPRRVPLDENLFRTVRAGFTQPRKTLLNNLLSSGVADRDVISKVFEKAGLSQTIRPHMLTEEEWMRVFSLLQGNHSNNTSG